MRTELPTSRGTGAGAANTRAKAVPAVVGALSFHLRTSRDSVEAEPATDLSR